MSKYHRKIASNEDGMSDVYDVLAAFHVTNPAIQHAVKKLLAPGERGGKTYAQDLEEARQSIVRAQQMQPPAVREMQMPDLSDMRELGLPLHDRPTIRQEDWVRGTTMADKIEVRPVQQADPGGWATQANPLPAEAITRPVAIGGGWTQTRPYTGLPGYANGRRFTKGVGTVAIILETEPGGECHLWMKGKGEAFMPIVAPHFKGHLGECMEEADVRLAPKEVEA